MRRLPPDPPEIAPSVVQDAIVQIMRSAHGNAHVDTDHARTMAGRLTPAVQKMGLHAASAAVLSANSAFHSLVAQHLGSATAANYDPDFRRKLLAAIEKANIHGPDYLAGVRDGIKLGLDAARRDSRVSESSERFSKAGMSAAASGNADARGFDLRSFYSSPATKALAGMGMSHNTFDYARREVPGASINNIRDSAGDAKALRFGVNDKAAIKDHTIIRKFDPKKADGVNKSLQDYQDGLDKDPVMAELIGKRNNATTPEEKKALDQQIQARRQEHRKESGVKGYIDDKANPKQSRDAAGSSADRVDKFYEQNRGLGVQKGANPTNQEIIQSHQNTGVAPALAGRAEASNASPTDAASRLRARADQPKAAPAAAGPAPGSK